MVSFILLFRDVDQRKTLKFEVPIEEETIAKNINSDVKKEILKKLNDNNCYLRKNVVYENVLQYNDDNDIY